jgi:hypothetical protein
MRYAILVTGPSPLGPFLPAGNCRCASSCTSSVGLARGWADLLCRVWSLLLGPAGSGKSTFCASIIAHAQSLNRQIHLFNLDPAATSFEYPPTIDIRDLISLEDVMEEMEFGPNGGLMYCFECVPFF